MKPKWKTPRIRRFLTKKPPKLPADAPDATEAQVSHSEDIELEAKLIEQDHRAYPVIRKFLYRHKRWSTDDPRHYAAIWAFAMWAISPGTIALASAAIGGSIGLGLTYWQTHLLSEQNELVRQEVEELQESIEIQGNQSTQLTQSIRIQRDQLDAQRKNDERLQIERYLKVLYDKDEKGKPIHNARLRTDAAIAYIKEQRRVQVQKSKVDLTKALLQDCEFINKDMSHVDFTKANLSGVTFRLCELSNSCFRKSDLRQIMFIDTTLNQTDFELATVSFHPNMWPLLNWELDLFQAMIDLLKDASSEKGVAAREKNLSLTNPTEINGEIVILVMDSMYPTPEYHTFRFARLNIFYRSWVNDSCLGVSNLEMLDRYAVKSARVPSNLLEDTEGFREVDVISYLTHSIVFQLTLKSNTSFE